MKKIFKNFNRNQSGFVILFTILISTIILMIGFGIFSVAIRETILSGTAREAQKSFYAADAGVECALYAQKSGLIAGSTSAVLPCGEGGTFIVSEPGFDRHEFDIQIGSTNTCAHVTIFTNITDLTRRVVAQGYNVCNGALPARANPILTERDLDVRYSYGTIVTPPPAPAPSP